MGEGVNPRGRALSSDACRKMHDHAPGRDGGGGPGYRSGAGGVAGRVAVRAAHCFETLNRRSIFCVCEENAALHNDVQVSGGDLAWQV